ncbi:hypothetical protein SERLA73DRAFT_145439 [Serpula lacrymans var. lacrymans S7.3]|uniref:Uncharacterized protein n=1 Tax=Serpula lacrymans var. lacrymans (strain S7.3) TaxID=936435 RepID=F8QDR3_SERL3|nr:hypothetical protein SERLA73DRAFT_145439 [Serpula lacrymans var. lacrymans S7.3]
MSYADEHITAQPTCLALIIVVNDRLQRCSSQLMAHDLDCGPNYRTRTTYAAGYSRVAFINEIQRRLEF